MMSQEEYKILDKMHRQKVAEVEKLSQSVRELEEALLSGAAAANAVRDYQRQVSELKVLILDTIQISRYFETDIETTVSSYSIIPISKSFSMWYCFHDSNQLFFFMLICLCFICMLVLLLLFSGREENSGEDFVSCNGYRKPNCRCNCK